MEGVEVQPHILLKKSQVHPVVLVMGDPARTKVIAEMCDSYTELASNREFRSFECVYKGEKFIVASHGVGSAGCGICFTEFIHLGAQVIIRAGTCGSLQPREIRIGDVVLVHSAVREDGVSRLLAPQGYPAVSSMKVYQTLENTAKEINVTMRSGMSLSSDLFYKSELIPSSLELYSKGNVEIVEMEASTLFVIGYLNKILTGCLCVVDGSPLQWDEGNYDTTCQSMDAGKKNMMLVSIEACAKLAKEYRTGTLLPKKK